MAHEWGKAFLACGRAGLRGFSQQNFTPYSHKILTHAGHMVTLVGGLERFSGEQLEKLNDEMKKGHLCRSNCQNIDISLMVQKRREMALMHFDLKKKSRDEGRIPKHSCQHPYQAYGARVMAQQRRVEGGSNSTGHDRLSSSPELLPSAELRTQLQDRTGESQYHQINLKFHH